MHKELEERFAETDVVFFHLQTVWEAEETNSPERGPREAKGFGIEVPVGYDAHVDGSRLSIVMHQFGTGGTPWTIVIDRAGIVRYNQVSPRRAEMEGLAELITTLHAEEAPDEGDTGSEREGESDRSGSPGES